MDYGQKIAGFREKCGLTQEEVACRLFVSRDLVSKWENNRRRPDRKTPNALAELFGEPASVFESPQDVLKELEACIPEACSVTPAELPSVLNSFLRTLPERDRSIFLRRYYFEDTPQEIAVSFDTGDGYVRVILSRTRKKLRRFLEKGENRS